MTRLEKIMGMSDVVWERHTNPLSGWSRMTILPLFTLAVWSRVWLGWWCLVPIGIVFAWTWWNPRAFAPPASTNNWMSKGVLGERVWLNRSNEPIPQHHLTAGHLLSLMPLLGLVPYVWGMIYLEIWLTITGLMLTMVGKLWFLDRMVWLFDDMVDGSKLYQGWVK